MATVSSPQGSLPQGSEFETEEWKRIVDGADRVYASSASGAPIDAELALGLARQILAFQRAYPALEADSGAETDPGRGVTPADYSPE